jgi:putative ABC transport system ATP-binding protein
MTPSCGTVRIAGHSIEGLSPEDLAKVRRDHIGFVFQSYHLFPTLTALDNVQLALDVRNERPRIAMSKASEALARVGLAHKRGSYPHELSGGEQQRVAIARAVVASPAVILADEPTAALDGENGQAIMTIIADIARNLGSTVLVVTHDPRLIRFGSRIIHIEDGHIVGEQPGGASPNRHAAERGKDRRGHPFTVVSRRPT